VNDFRTNLQLHENDGEKIQPLFTGLINIEVTIVFINDVEA
jgi:hypothetical protein